jgi:hypothetical protein
MDADKKRRFSGVPAVPIRPPVVRWLGASFDLVRRIFEMPEFCDSEKRGFSRSIEASNPVGALAGAASFLHSRAIPVLSACLARSANGIRLAVRPEQSWTTARGSLWPLTIALQSGAVRSQPEERDAHMFGTLFGIRRDLEFHVHRRWAWSVGRPMVPVRHVVFDVGRVLVLNQSCHLFRFEMKL